MPYTITPEDMEWVKRIVRACQRTIPSTFQFDDLYGAGCVGLVKASRKYDEGRGTAWKPFAKSYIRGEIFMSVRRKSWTEAHHAELKPAHDVPIYDEPERPELAFPAVAPRSALLLSAMAERTSWKQAAAELRVSIHHAKLLGRVAFLDAKAAAWRQCTGYVYPDSADAERG